MHNYMFFLSKSPTTYLGLSGVGTMLVRLDDVPVDEVTVVTDTKESVEDDDGNDDEAELELLDDDDEEENLSAGVSLPM